MLDFAKGLAMYKLLLSWRYLKTRFIALASIVSVTLGVATLIVVNSVMSGFVTEMKDRLHGILSDIEIADPGLGEIPWPELHVAEVKKVLGDDVEAITTIVRVPALLNVEFRDRQWTQQIMLMGVDEKNLWRGHQIPPVRYQRTQEALDPVQPGRRRLRRKIQSPHISKCWLALSPCESS